MQAMGNLGGIRVVVRQQRKTTAKQVVEYGEGFFKSLGLQSLPDTFWARSMFTRPADREVVCHASAWHIDLDQDVRLKVCVHDTTDDFVTVHHELGHVYYFLAYRNQPVLFRSGANDGFHEAIGDAIALSITPEYLKKLGLIDTIPPPSADLPLLLRTAMDKIAFLPFGLLIDRSTSGAGKCFQVRSNQPITTRRGGSCAKSIRAWRRRWIARKPISTPARNITFRAMFRTPATSWHGFISSSSIVRCAAPLPTRDR